MPPSSIQLVPAVDRAVRMLADLGAATEGKRISDLARDLGIPKSSAFQIATTLVHHGLLACDDDTRRYRLGQGLAHIVGAQHGRSDLPLLAAPHLERLAVDTGLTALLGVPTGDSTMLVAKADSPEPLGVGAPLGYRLDRRSGAFGKVFAADLDAAARTAFVRHLPAFTARSVTAPAAYRKELDRVRERGYATDVEEYLDGVRAVAAPVRDRDGITVAAVCVVGLAARLRRAEMKAAADRVCGAAAALSQDLGFTSAGAGA